METLPYEAQTALVSFSTAILIGGPVALIGAGRTLALARIAAGFAMKRRLATGLGLSLLTWMGAAAGGLLPDAAPAAGLLSGLFH